MAQLTTKYQDAKNGRMWWKCVMSPRGCDHVQAGNTQLDRVVKHSVKCKYLQSEKNNLWEECVVMWDEWSLGAKIEKADNEGRSGQGGDNRDEVKEDVLGEPASERSHQGQLNVMQLKKAGKKEKKRMQQLYQDHVDLVIMKLICVCGVIPKVIDSPEWKALMNLLNPVYKPTSTDTFHDKYIPHEAVHVFQKQVEVLH